MYEKLNKSKDILLKEELTENLFRKFENQVKKSKTPNSEKFGNCSIIDMIHKSVENGIERVLLALTLPLLLYALFLSASRTGIVAVSFGSLVLILILSRKFALVILIAIAAVAIQYGGNLLVNLAKHELWAARFQDLGGDLSVLWRFYIWLGTFNLITAYPHILITGIGLGAFQNTITPFVSLLPRGANAAHNQYLHHLAETGIAGLGVFLYLIYTLLRTSFRRMREPYRKFSKLYLGYFCGLCAIIISGLTQDILSVMEAAMWNYLGYFFLVTAVVFAEPKKIDQ